MAFDNPLYELQMFGEIVHFGHQQRSYLFSATSNRHDYLYIDAIFSQYTTCSVLADFLSTLSGCSHPLTKI
jgi:hypothetical protein